MENDGKCNCSLTKISGANELLLLSLLRSYPFGSFWIQKSSYLFYPFLSFSQFPLNPCNHRCSAALRRQVFGVGNSAGSENSGASVATGSDSANRTLRTALAWQCRKAVPGCAKTECSGAKTADSFSFSILYIFRMFTEKAGKHPTKPLSIEQTASMVSMDVGSIQQRRTVQNLENGVRM